MLFSQRKGLTKAIKELQVKEVDIELRNRLWNLMVVHYWRNYEQGYGDDIRNSNLGPLLSSYWHSFFKWAIDRMPENFYRCLDILREEFFGFPWYRVFDFLEFTIQKSDYKTTQLFATMLVTESNAVLEEENSAYRIVNNQFVEITSDSEIESIEEAVHTTSQLFGVQTHLSRAIEHLSNRENPDYRNSIKESISAVESICQILTGDKNATLGKALGILEKQMKLHGAIKSGFSSLYGYTSSAEGIRHALLDEPTLTFVDAKYMLVTCTAFINYIIGHSANLGIDLKDFENT